MRKKTDISFLRKEEVYNKAIQLEDVERVDFSVAMSATNRPMYYVNLHVYGSVYSCQVPAFLRDRLPKEYKEHISIKKALQIAGDFLIDPIVERKKNGQGLSMFISGKLKCDGSDYSVVIGRILKGQLPVKHTTWKGNKEVYDKVTSLGFEVLSVDLMASNPTFYMSYKGYECDTSARSLKQGSFPNIYNFYHIYNSSIEKAKSEGFIDPSVEYGGGFAQIVLTKGDISVKYPLSNFRAGNRPAELGFSGGFSKDLDGYLYILLSEDKSAIKVGISNNVARRLVEHERLSPFPFELMDCFHFPNGGDAYRIEQAVHDMGEILSAKQRDGSISKEWMKFDGDVIKNIRDAHKAITKGQGTLKLYKGQSQFFGERSNRGERWIETVRSVHDYKYDYSKTVFSGLRNKVIIICPDHGEFEQTPKAHLKSGCPTCADYSRALLSEEWIVKAQSVYGDQYNYSLSEYVNNYTKVKIICPEHGEFEQRPVNHLQGQCCPKCAKLFVSGKRLKTNEEWIAESRAVHGDKYDYSLSKYVKAKSEVKIICPIHGQGRITLC